MPHLASSQGSLHGTDAENHQRGRMMEDDSSVCANSDGDSESDGNDESFELRPKQIRFSCGGDEPENFISDD